MGNFGGKRIFEVGRLRNSETVSTLDEKWIMQAILMRHMSRLHDAPLIMVSRLLTEDHQWNVPSIHNIFFAPDVEMILKLPLQNTGGEDCLACSKQKAVHFVL
jgi:hypothetical protein